MRKSSSARSVDSNTHYQSWPAAPEGFPRGLPWHSKRFCRSCGAPLSAPPARFGSSQSYTPRYLAGEDPHVEERARRQPQAGNRPLRRPQGLVGAAGRPRPRRRPGPWMNTPTLFRSYHARHVKDNHQFATTTRTSAEVFREYRSGRLRRVRARLRPLHASHGSTAVPVTVRLTLSRSAAIAQEMPPRIALRIGDRRPGNLPVSPRPRPSLVSSGR